MDASDAAADLANRFKDAVRDRGGDLQITASKRELNASVTWLESKIYDHIDVAFQVKTGIRKWEETRSVEEAATIVEECVMAWLRDGPPPAEEEARRRFERLAGGLLQVDPAEIDDASKTDPSDNDSVHDEEE